MLPKRNFLFQRTKKKVTLGYFGRICPIQIILLADITGIDCPCHGNICIQPAVILALLNRKPQNPLAIVWSDTGVQGSGLDESSRPIEARIALVSGSSTTRHTKLTFCTVGSNNAKDASG
jgi:hypothetical protein